VSTHRLSLYYDPAGVTTTDGPRVVFDVERGEAWFGASEIDGRALRWELESADAEPPAAALLSAEVTLGAQTPWLMRVDRVDFPPGAEARTHTHPGPGIRCLVAGELRVETGGESHTYGPFEAWFESGPDPVYAIASSSEDTAFVRVMLLPAEWAGRRTIRYVDPADTELPAKQRATIFFEQPLAP
jgi:quercetin dioxygenase-like cupin family protein